jgi:hypothetical protein
MEKYIVEISDYNGKTWEETAETLDFARGIADDCFGEGSTCDGVTIYNEDGEIVEMYDEDGDLMD